MSGPIAIAVLTASLAACAGRSQPPAPPVASAPAREAAPSTAAPDARPSPEDADGAPEEPSYGELMRGEGAVMTGRLAQAELRRWLAPLHALDTSSCQPRAMSAAFHDCWCRLICGLRFEARAATVRVSWPFTGAGGPGLEVAPDGHVRECFDSSTSERVPYTALVCPAPR